MEFEQMILKNLHALAGVLQDYFVLEKQIRLASSFKTGVNDDREIVTNVDREVEETCIKFLSRIFPDIPAFAEEHYRNGDVLPEKGWVFVIDPIDGTSELAAGKNEWSISLAAVNDLSPRVGMLIMPQRALIISACRGKGVMCNGETMMTKQRKIAKKRIAVSPRQIQIPQIKTRIGHCGLIPVAIPTLTVKIISILLGRVEAGVYFPQEKKSANVWDYAAAILLLEEFGGKMTSLDGSAMPFGGQKIIHRDGWLATSRFCCHDELLSKLRRQNETIE